jgi:hypothetical protein
VPSGLWILLVLSIGSPKHFNDLGYFLALVGFVSTCNRMLDAMGNVIAQYFFFCTPKRRPDCGDLRHYIDAITALPDHPRKTPYLTFDTAKSF